MIRQDSGYLCKYDKILVTYDLVEIRTETYKATDRLEIVAYCYYYTISKQGIIFYEMLHNAIT